MGKCSVVIPGSQIKPCTNEHCKSLHASSCWANPWWGWEHTVLFPKNGSSLLFLSHPTIVLLSFSPAASAPPPGWETHCVSPMWAGGSRTWLRMELFVWRGSCSTLLDQKSSGQPCPRTWRGVPVVNVWHRNHFSVFRGGRQIQQLLDAHFEMYSCNAS